MNLGGRIGAVLALLALTPVFGAIALAIRLDDGGPVLFRQIRVGRYGRHFTMYKFRSMRSAPGRPLTCEGDPRITRAGRLLRRYKLDELPQFWNIVKGEMAWIGPRPEIPEFVSMEDPLWRQVLQFRPGLADAASVEFRDEERLLASVPNPQEYYRREILPRKLRISIEHSLRRSRTR
ncbi:MAG TPA: sugar transferase [Bryobacteraceae bacterium]|nr:sugar transferase [Bryobacteraceae bacterium]